MKSLHLGLTALGAFFLSLGIPNLAQAQAPVVNGQASQAEYGNNYGSIREQFNPNLRWHMTWDDTNLYIGLQDVAVQHVTVIYLDTDPQPVVNGEVGNGALRGVDINGTNGDLPFRADGVIYFRQNANGQNVVQYQRYDIEGGQFPPQASSNGATVALGSRGREISIPWSLISITGARPTAFNWFGYNIDTNRGNTVYGPAPRTNPKGLSVTGNDIPFSRYFTVLNTAAGTAGEDSAFGPNDFNSYTHVGSSNFDFGGLSVYDFTFNSPNTTITRSAASDAIWDIRGDAKILNNSSLNLGASTAPVTVAGDLTIQQEAQFNFTNPNGGSLAVGGDFEFEDAGRSIVEVPVRLVGTGDQSISGDIYSRLTIDGTGTKTLVGNNLTITNALILNSGTLATGSYLVDLGTVGTVTESADGYVSGVVQSSKNIVGSGSYDFGNIGLILTSPQASSAYTRLQGNITAQRITGNFGIDGTPDQNKTIRRRYLITNTSTSQSQRATAAFSYRTANPNELEGNDPTSLRLYQSTDRKGPYTPAPNVVAISSSNANTSTFNGDFTFNDRYYSLGDGTNPLPVELISFTGTAENSAARLNWATASEKQNKGFEVERRTDQSEWKTLGFVNGNGTTNQRHTYSYVDRAPAAGNNYYRLRQIDLDGKSVYSQPVTVQLDAVAFTLSPVPATDVLTINGLGTGQHTAEIYNSRGQRVLSKEFSADAATTVAVSALPAGVYMVHVLGADRSTRNARFIKE